KGILNDDSRFGAEYDVTVPNSPVDDEDLQLIQNPLGTTTSNQNLINHQGSHLWASGIAKWLAFHNCPLTKFALQGVPQRRIVEAPLQETGPPNGRDNDVPILEGIQIRTMEVNAPLNLSRLNQGLSLRERKVAAYMFERQKDNEEPHLEELLVKQGNYRIFRGEMVSLAPKWTPHSFLINFTCYVQSISSTKNGGPRVWFLPSDFAKEIRYRVGVEHIRKDYEKRWMIQTDCLEHIFIPILDLPDAWYLMLLDVKLSMCIAWMSAAMMRTKRGE
ncbi:hypothetical protein PIB30_081634, partial [Stylosanthes scabra]|nr:hypothetical protein [Stylosanthes scabra]